MKKHRKPLSADIPISIKEVLEHVPVFTPEMEAELYIAFRELDFEENGGPLTGLKRSALSLQ